MFIFLQRSLMRWQWTFCWEVTLQEHRVRFAPRWADAFWDMGPQRKQAGSCFYPVCHLSFWWAISNDAALSLSFCRRGSETGCRGVRVCVHVLMPKCVCVCLCVWICWGTEVVGRRAGIYFFLRPALVNQLWQAVFWRTWQLWNLLPEV